MGQLVDTEEAAKIKGVSPRTIRREFERGKLEGEFKANNRGGKSGLKLFVYINDEPNPPQSAEGIAHSEKCTLPKNENGICSHLWSADDNGKMVSNCPPRKCCRGCKKMGNCNNGCRNASEFNKDKKVKDRCRVGRGEPGCHVVTPIVNGEPCEVQSQTSQGGPITEALPSGNSSLLDPSKEFSPACAEASAGRPDGGASPGDSPYSTNLPSVDSVNRDSPCQSLNLPVLFKSPACAEASAGRSIPARINPKLEKIGYLRFAILNAWREELSGDHKSKTQVIIKFLQLYNSGLLLPAIYNDIDSISRATLYSWDKAEKLGGVRALIPQYGGPSGSKITEYEKYILLNILLHQNRLKIGSAIKFTKVFLSYKKIESPSSEATLRRFIDEFKRTRYDAWVEAREGAKALNDKCLPYAERNWRLLTVGEGLVADGHRLNFQVINPFTGKPCRATIVLFWDWKSSYPLGWEIMLEESIQCIASALRNGILTLGKIPKWLLIDNGKAFKANVFTSDIDLEDGITYGMFATLGIHTHFSQAYNPQEKPLERFWGTFNNWFERLVPSYTGASIPDKPPYMLRNEKDAQARHNEWVPKIEEVQEMLLKFREFYSDQPSRGRDGLTPREIFEAEKGPGVDPDELTYLMMAKEIKSVGRNGVTWNGWHITMRHYTDTAIR
jgi:putative transposase